MSLLDVTRAYSDGNALTGAMIDAFLDDIEIFINTTKISDDNIQDNGITGSTKLINASIPAAKLATNSVSTDKIIDLNVTEAKLAADAVITTKILDANITVPKLAADVLALLVPSGAILAFGGAAAPAGFLLCDGSAVSRTTYASLFTAVGVSFGQGDNSTTFNVPDLRGRFLRGIDASQGRDPDAASRTAMNTGGNVGDNIGSIQSDAFRAHNHTFESYATNTGSSSAPALRDATVSNLQTENVTTSGGNETRPINAAVNYLIKT